MLRSVGGVTRVRWTDVCDVCDEKGECNRVVSPNITAERNKMSFSRLVWARRSAS